MKKIFICLLIGIIAGVLDVIPMILMDLNITACVSAFVQWIVLGIFINYIDLSIRSWLKGILVAELAALPILIIVSAQGYSDIIPIIISSAILGALVGYFGSRFSNN